MSRGGGVDEGAGGAGGVGGFGRAGGAGGAGDAGDAGDAGGADPGGEGPGATPTGARVALLSVGDELLAGDVADTNAHWIARALARHGLRLVACFSVGDRVQEIARAVRRAREDAEWLLVTGGLGPTADDLTREGVAAALGLELELRQDLLEALRSRGRRVSEGSARQASLPVGAEVLPNGRGTAPGFLVCDGAFSVAVMPGVPGEMRAMLERLLEGQLPPGPLRPALEVKAIGLAESEAGDRLGELMDPEVAGCRVGITVSCGVLTVTVRGEDPQAMTDAAHEVARRLGDHVFASGPSARAGQGNAPARVLVGLLAEAKSHVSCAESCTGGLLAGAITSVPGASDVFDESLVTYANEAKQARLGVPGALLEEHGAVSDPVARAMAEGCLQATGADLALAVTGIAGPGGGSDDKPVGTVFVSVADAGGCVVKRLWAGGSRDEIRARAVNMALDLGRRRLLGLV